MADLKDVIPAIKTLNLDEPFQQFMVKVSTELEPLIEKIKELAEKTLATHTDYSDLNKVASDIHAKLPTAVKNYLEQQTATSARPEVSEPEPIAPTPTPGPSAGPGMGHGV